MALNKQKFQGSNFNNIASQKFTSFAHLSAKQIRVYQLEINSKSIRI